MSQNPNPIPLPGPSPAIALFLDETMAAAAIARAGATLLCPAGPGIVLLRPEPGLPLRLYEAGAVLVIG
ncbi:hypothetical protein C8P66_107162 [Humitalea rosea]|uniref:Uncharacterized protein n=1 Tax=Humitalea rosea TaxID=990373 RepID=A0A2W7IJI7_9PROT|nr:hypothetical protein [Humitalea rosea]PZW47124.1 hypothetical protein C8P66_107162 [Humitalea rosea]